MKNIPNDWKEENLTKMFDGLGEITQNLNIGGNINQVI